jgi:hypothetical protein
MTSWLSRFGSSGIPAIVENCNVPFGFSLVRTQNNDTNFFQRRPAGSQAERMGRVQVPQQQVPATDAGIPVLPIPHSNPFADANSNILQKVQATAKTDTGMDFCRCVDSGKRKMPVGCSIASGSLFILS